ncbi:uncharacterized protein LOC141655696 [Silene latifolia]|uniref:uncharacterized protein LOC141655696 n=1 Tax=Silene latifolia TaxID=37657 RepID=UPI003D788C91
MEKAVLQLQSKLQKGIISFSSPNFLSSFSNDKDGNFDCKIALSQFHKSNDGFLNSGDKDSNSDFKIALSRFLNSSEKDCNFRIALSQFDALVHSQPTPHISAFTSILNPLFKNKQYSTYIALCNKLDFLPVRPHFYMINMIIKCYCQLGRADLGLSLMGKLMKLGFQPNIITFTNLIHGLCVNNGNVGAAVALFRKAVDQGWQMSVLTYGTLINRLCKVGQTDEALKMLRMMRLNGVEPDVVIYSAAIDGLCKQKLMSQAEQLFSEMVSKGVIPDAITYSTLILGHCNLGQWGDVQRLLRETADTGTELSALTFNQLFHGLSRDGNLREMEHIIDLMTDAGWTPNLFSYNIWIDGFSKQGLMDKAQEIVEIMIAKGFTPNVITYSILINGYCKLRRIDAAMALLKEMSQKGLCPNTVTYNSLLDMLCKEGKTKEAEKIMKMMIDKNQDPNTVNYTTLIQGYCRNGLMDKAQETFETMVSKGCVPNVVTFNCLIDGYFKQKRMNDVLSTFKEMFENRLAPNEATYRILVQMLYAEGKSKEAESITKLMATRNQDPMVVIYKALACENCKTFLCKKGNPRFHGTTRYYSCDSASPVLLSKNFLGQLNVLAKECLASGESGLGSGQYIYGTLQSPSFWISPEAEQWMINTDGACFGSIVGAVSVAVDQGWQISVSTYGPLINRLCKVGQFGVIRRRAKRSRNIIDLMIDAGCTSNLLSYNTWIDGLCKQGLMDKAQEIVEIMIAKGITPNVFTYNILINGYCKLTRTDAVIALLKEMLYVITLGVNPFFDNLVSMAKAMLQLQSKLLIWSHPIINYVPLSFYHKSHFLSDKDCNFDSEIALTQFDTLLHSQPIPHITVFTSILKPLFKMKQYFTFIALCKKLDLLPVFPDFYMLNMIIKCYCQMGHADLGLSLLGKLLKFGFQPNIITVTNLIHGLCVNNGNVGAAVALFRKAVDQGWQMSASTYVIAADSAPIVLISAQLKYNTDVVCKYLVKKIHFPKRNMIVIFCCTLCRMRERVFNIRLDRERRVDSWYWAFERNGEYTVRSAYKLLAGEEPEMVETSSWEQSKWIWNNLWKVQVWPRVKLFFWQLCNDALATKVNLSFRVGHDDVLCPLCQCQVESSLHLFRDCWVARGVWEEVGLLEEERDGEGDVRAWVEGCWREMGKREYGLMMVVCWAIWEARNRVIFDGGGVAVEDVVRRVQRVLEEIDGELVVRGKDEGGSKETGGVQGDEWRRPSSGWVKLNVDAGVKDGVGVGVGVVCRDSSGKVLWGMTHNRREVWEAHVAEAVAVLEGLEQAREAGHDRVVVESDCSQVIEALKQRKTGQSLFSLVLDDILRLCSSFSSVVWSFISRKNNVVAHTLAHVIHKFIRILVSMAKAMLHFNTSLQKGIFISFSSPFFLSSFQSHPIINYVPLSFYHKTPFFCDDSGDKDCNFDCEIVLTQFDTLLHAQPIPHITVFTSILKPLFKMKQYSTFIALCNKLDLLPVFPDFYMLNMIIKCYCQLGHADLGLSLMGKLLKLGFQPNIITFTNLIHGLCVNNGNVGAAVALVRKAVDQGWQMSESTYGTLINRLCKVGQVDEAFKLLRMMTFTGVEPDVISYTTVIDGLCKHKLMSQAQQLFSKMITKGVIPNAITFSTLIWGYCNLGKLREVKHIIDLMTDAGCTPDLLSYNTWIDGLCKQGLMDKAQEIVEIMIAKGFTPDVFTYNILINGYCKLRRMDAVIALCNEMSQKGLSPDTFTYNSWFDILCKEGKIKKVAKVMKLMIDKKQGPNTVNYTTLIQGYCRMGLMDKAQETFETMVSKGCAPNVVTFNCLIYGYAKQKRMNDVLSTFKEMSKNRLAPNEATYRILVLMLYKEGKNKEAESIIKLMATRNQDPMVVIYKALAGENCKTL